MNEVLHTWVLVRPLGKPCASFSEWCRAVEYADALLEVCKISVAITHKNEYRRWEKTSGAQALKGRV